MVPQGTVQQFLRREGLSFKKRALFALSGAAPRSSAIAGAGKLGRIASALSPWSLLTRPDRFNAGGYTLVLVRISRDQ
jgi:hypothetical protein